MTSTFVAPPYSIIFISDVAQDGMPEEVNAHIVWTDQAICISCRYWDDGDTRVTLGPVGAVGRFSPPVFDGFITTPNRQVVVSSAHDDVILQADVVSTRTRVRIWENHPTEPDDIVIGLS